MNAFEVATVAVGAAGVVLNSVLFVVVVLQLRAVRRQVTAAERTTLLDHQRRKKQATIDFYAMTLESRLSLPANLPFDREADRVTEFLRGVGQTDNSSVRVVTDYLSLFELLATGVNTDVFDLEVISRMAGGRIRAMVRNYGPWIESRREQQNAPMLFAELLHLAKRLEKLEIHSEHDPGEGQPLSTRS